MSKTPAAHSACVCDVMTRTWCKTSALGKRFFFCLFFRKRGRCWPSCFHSLVSFDFLCFYLTCFRFTLSWILHNNMHSLTLQKYFLLACFGTLSLVYISPWRGPKRVPCGMYSLLKTPVTWNKKGINHFNSTKKWVMQHKEKVHMGSFQLFWSCRDMKPSDAIMTNFAVWLLRKYDTVSIPEPFYQDILHSAVTSGPRSASQGRTKADE